MHRWRLVIRQRSTESRSWARKTHSPLLEVDVKNWTLDFFVNAGVGAAFLLAFWLAGTRWSYLVPYVDPVLLTALVIVLIWVPVKTVKDNVAELLVIAPPPPLQHEVRGRFNRAIQGVPVEKTYVRMSKVGRYFYILNQIVVPRSFKLDRVKNLDDIRRKIATELEDIHPKLVIDTLFTEDDSLTK